MERTIFLQPDLQRKIISVAEYWTIIQANDTLISIPQNAPEIPIQLPADAQKLIIPDNSLGSFQKISNNQVLFIPTLTLDATQNIGFPLLYEIPYPENGKITFQNPLISNRTSISLPAADIRIEAEGFSYDGKRTVKDTSADVYRNQGMQANSQFTIQLIRSNPPNTSTSQYGLFLFSLVCLIILLIFWFKSTQNALPPDQTINAGQ